MQNDRNLERAVTVITGTLMVYFGARKRSMFGGALALAGVGLVRRGALGDGRANEFHFGRVITIAKPKEEVFRFWRNLENLPRFMKTLKSVKVLSPTRSRWVMNGPGERTVEWEAELVCQTEGESLSWRSLPGARIPNSGTVQFEDAAGKRGTIVRVSVSYNPPCGVLGGVVAKLIGHDPEGQLAEDLRNLKSILESGQIANSSEPSRIKVNDAREKQIQDASEHSFPASDAPAYR